MSSRWQKVIPSPCQRQPIWYEEVTADVEGASLSGTSPRRALPQNLPSGVWPFYVSAGCRNHEGRNSEFVVSITDAGVPYSPTQNQRRIFRNSGLGRLTFDQLGIDGGQRVTFRMPQRHGHVMPEPPKRHEEALADANVTCRRTTTSTDDILEAICCLYDAYGYGYLHQALYHTEQFRALICGGKYVSLLAKNEHRSTTPSRKGC